MAEPPSDAVLRRKAMRWQGLFMVLLTGYFFVRDTGKGIPEARVVSCSPYYSHGTHWSLVLDSGQHTSVSRNEVYDQRECLPPGTLVEKRPWELAYRIGGVRIGWYVPLWEAPMVALFLVLMVVGFIPVRPSRTEERWRQSLKELDAATIKPAMSSTPPPPITSTTSAPSGTPPTSGAAARLAAWLDALPAAQRDALARRYAEATAAGGATMLKPDGRVLPIPPLLTPEILDTAQLAAVEQNAHAVTDGLSRLTAWLMGDPGAHAAIADRLFRAFGGYEREALLSTWHEAERLATVRVDYLIDEAGAPHALEVNATIPAMQGYSDIVAAAFLREVGAERGVPAGLADALLDENGRNADQLLASLLAHDRLLDHLTGKRPGVPEDGARRIVLVARPGDSQTGELRHLTARWNTLGHHATLVTPDEIRLEGGVLTAGSERPDIVYRHVFARRLDPASPFARACLDPRRHRILNPIASHLEAKGMLGLLSRAADPGEGTFTREVNLPDEVRHEVHRSVPWTRVLTEGPSRGPDGGHIEDLVRTVVGEPHRFVIKKSWDYGGRSVFLGAEHDEGAARRAAEVMEREGSMSWSDLVHAAVTDPRDVWVVQEFVSASTRRHLVTGDGHAEWKQLYVDLSVYTNLGVEERPRGGVTRAAMRRIVNLQGGGGLAPLIRTEVIDRLLDAGQ